MGSVNKVILVGRLGKDPESRRSQSDTLIVKFPLATDRRGQQNADAAANTDWHNVVVFGKTAEFCERYLTKGRQVYVEGRIEYSKQEKDGVTRYYTSVVASSVEILSSDDRGANPNADGTSSGPSAPRSAPGGGSRSPAPSSGFDDINDSDIPF